MRKHTLMIVMIAAFLGVLAAPARAQKSGVGVGVESILTSKLPGAGIVIPAFPGAATVTYDTGTFYAGGMLMFSNVDNGDTVFGIGGRFYFPVHHGSSSDFALGGAMALVNTDPNQTGMENDTSFHIELGARIRAWLTRNVEVDAGVGIGILVADSGGPPPDRNEFGLVGDLVSSLGVSYFFW